MSLVAVVMPIYKHAGLVIEAVNSALWQIASFDCVIVLVNDGCPFEETDIVCRQYAISYPGKVFYLHKPNGGLSSARNAGMDFALSAFPELSAIYLMDADNRIGPLLLQKSYDILFSAPEDVGWAYPDIHKFGISEYCDMSGPYKVIEHLLMNISEAGSMIKRQVLDQGLRYDEDMKLGYEDWEFWLQCIAAGFKGVHVPDAGFMYRQRGESMLKDSERHHGEIMSYIYKKHEKLFSRRNLLLEEQKAFFRFAIYNIEERSFIYTTDYARERRDVDYSQFALSALEFQARPEIGSVPGYTIFAAKTCLDTLHNLGLLHGIFWQLQRRLDKVNLACLHIETFLSPVTSIELSGLYGGRIPGAHLVMCRTDLLHECMNSQDTDWIDSVLGEAPQPTSVHFLLRMGLRAGQSIAAGAGDALPHLVHALRATKQTVLLTPARRTFIQEQRMALSRPDEFCLRLHKARHLLPLMPAQEGADDGANVAFLLPVAEFGGVEKVAFNYAKVMKAKGARPHLFVVGAKSRAVIMEEFETVFDTITFFEDDHLGTYSNSMQEDGNYLGSGLPLWEKVGSAEDAFGMLCGMNMVINFQVPQFHALMSRLRKTGAKTYSSQHLVDLSWNGQPIGSPHQFLAYEHAYDGVLVISEQLRAWFIANGVPSEKLIHVPNCGSYTVSLERRREIMRERGKREAGPLRVLYIGRFDRQKGLDRLSAVIDETVSEGLPITWRVVGKSIVDDDQPDLASLSPYLFPPAHTPEELNQHFEWADVVLLVSRFEGVPLTILEAGRLGCVVLSTKVGAVDEIVLDGRTGLLFDQDVGETDLTERICRALGELASHRSTLQEMSQFAEAHYGTLDWEKSLMPFLNSVSLVAG